MKSVTVYEASDGEKFATAEECKAYEAGHHERRLVGLSMEQVQAALTRQDTVLADAIENLGKRIAAARVEAGETRRPKRKAAEAAKAEVPSPSAEEAALPPPMPTDEPAAAEPADDHHKHARKKAA